MRLLIFVFLLLISLSSFAQKFAIQGVVRDSVSGVPIPFGSYLIKGTIKGGICDDQGSFRIEADSLPITLVFNATGYKTISRKIEKAEIVSVLLSPKIYQMKEVIISSESVNVWHKKDAWTFIDFAFYDDFILALVAMQNSNRNFLVLMDVDGKTVSTIRVRSDADSIYTDCIGTLHLFARDSVYQIYYDYENLSLPYASPLDEFVVKMLPCKCRVDDYYYFGFSTYHGQKLNYYFINWYKKGAYTLFRSVHDSDKIESYNQNYDVRYFLEQRRLYGYYAEPLDSITKKMDYYRSLLPLTQQEQRWLSPVNAPLVRLGNEIVIFSCLDSTLETYSKEGKLIHAVPFFIHRDPTYKEHELYVDDMGQALYGRCVSKDGISTFMKIDTKTGKIISKTEVPEYPFISNPVIEGGQLYFLWKDPAMDQPRKIYVMKME